MQGNYPGTWFEGRWRQGKLPVFNKTLNSVISNACAEPLFLLIRCAVLYLSRPWSSWFTSSLKWHYRSDVVGSILCTLLSYSFPLVITGVTVKFLNSSTLKVSWDAALPGENVQGYDVIILEDANELRRVGAANVTSSVEIPSLDECSNYTVKVAVNSSVGPGNYSRVGYVTTCGKWDQLAVSFVSWNN